MDLDIINILKRHSLAPINRVVLDDSFETYHNLSCGDSVKLKISIVNDLIEVFFDAKACSLTISSCSILLENINHRSKEEALMISKKVINALSTNNLSDLDFFNIFSNYLEKPIRLNCIKLPLEALIKELEK